MNSDQRRSDYYYDDQVDDLNDEEVILLDYAAYDALDTYDRYGDDCTELELLDYVYSNYMDGLKT